MNNAQKMLIGGRRVGKTAAMLQEAAIRITELEAEKLLLVQALKAMLTATNNTEKESFPGHHEAYLRTVAIPRARSALEEVAK